MEQTLVGESRVMRRARRARSLEYQAKRARSLTTFELMWSMIGMGRQHGHLTRVEDPLTSKMGLDALIENLRGYERVRRFDEYPYRIIVDPWGRVVGDDVHGMGEWKPLESRFAESRLISEEERDHLPPEVYRKVVKGDEKEARNALESLFG